ncbi:MAG TPA: XdhC family protein, partial [Candidatus Binatia bacterium]|nr:XdhC family protein [Candidatus Binatia bacterium]
RAEKPTSGKPGDKAIITVDGAMYGWIGGSCAQPTVVRESLSALAEDTSHLIRLSVAPDEQTPREGLEEMAMTCYSGGTLEIFIEPHHPRPRLLIVGGLPVARSLAHLASAMNYQVVVVDPATDGAGIAHADKVLDSLEDVESQIGPFTYVVVATHGTHDEVALERILKCEPGYVGLVASPRRAAAVREYLATRGVSAQEMLSLKSPAGLDIQAQRGDEIALSIMAEIVQKRRNAELLDLALFRVDDEEVASPGDAPTLAVDPVCHMEVDISGAAHRSEYEGDTYYFCCAGCQASFEEDPLAYLESEAASH